MPELYLTDYPDDEPDFFFEPDECFPFDDNEELDYVFEEDDKDEDEKKYPYKNMSNVSKAIWDFFAEKDDDILI